MDSVFDNFADKILEDYYKHRLITIKENITAIKELTKIINKMEKEKMTMTLKEIFLAFGNEEILINKETGLKAQIKDNVIVNIENGTPVSFVGFRPENWEIYKDPKDPKNWMHKLCVFWNEEDKTFGLLLSYHAGEEVQFYNGTRWYDNCRPATKEEAEQYLVKEDQI